MNTLDILNETITKYQNKLAYVIKSYDFLDLMDFHLESQCGSDLAILVQEILSMTLSAKFFVTGIEVSDGKYWLTCNTQEDSEYFVSCKGSYNKDVLQESLLNGIVIPYIKTQILKT